MTVNTPSAFAVTRGARPATVRRVIENPFIALVADLVVDGDDSMTVTFQDPTARELGRYQRQLTEAGKARGVTVRRTSPDETGEWEAQDVKDEDGKPVLVDGGNGKMVPAVVDVPIGVHTITFYAVTQIKRGVNDADDGSDDGSDD